MAANHIERVAIVGATGHVGGHFARALLKTGKHTVTAITRADSTADVPTGAKVARVDYDNEQSLVSALEGQQFLVITLSARAPEDLHQRIVRAAIKANVPYIMPNIYGFDPYNIPADVKPLFDSKFVSYLSEIEQSGSTSYVVMSCGYWYEWSLALGEQWFGFDFKNDKVTLLDDGMTEIDVSTWPQCGRALAALLSLPVSGASPCLEDWKNKQVFLNSFKINQRKKLDSVNRVMGRTDKDWDIHYEPSDQRYKDGIQELQQGQFVGFAKAMYSAYFYPNGNGSHPSEQSLINDVLGLPKEDFDEQTKVAVDMVKNDWNPFAQ